MILLTAVGGVVTLAIGYASVIFFGGIASLPLAHLMSVVTGSEQVFEEVEPVPTVKHKVLHEALPAYIVGIVFITAVALSWDLFNLDSSKAWIFYSVVHSLDIFVKAPTLSIATHSLDVMPKLITLVFLGGAAPAMALPFFRNFKITGVNSGSFHTSMLTSVVGTVVGLGALLTFVGLIYRVLWVSSGSHLYHYAILTMLGLSIFYGIGAFFARGKAERMALDRLKAASKKSRVHLGKVSVESAT
jgi:hypothetical protein